METVFVDLFMYEKAHSPSELYSGGLGPCLALGAIYGQKGYMVHFPAASIDVFRVMEPFFRDLERDVKDKSRLKIYAAGGTLYPDFNNEDTLAGRAAVLRTIAEYKFQDAIREVSWGENHRQGMSLRLILLEGRAELQEFDLPQLF